jgi:tetratricopeptide (TPR) repeat protein
MRGWGLLFFLLAACGGGDPLVRGEASLVSGDLPEAERHFRNALDASPDEVDALYGLGWVYHLSGRSSRARDYFTRCIRLDSTDHRGYKGLGSLALGEGNFQVAERRFQEALEREPANPAVLNSMALTYMGAGRYQEAIDLLQPLVAGDAGRGELGLNLAESHFRLKHYDESLTTIEAALSREISEKRFRALLHELRAMVLVRLTSGRLNTEDCEATLPPLLETLSIADKDLDFAEAIGVDLPNLNAARLRIHRRRSRIQEDCPLDAAEISRN